ncbi:MAG TPA: hypothetical protein VF903_09910 [Nitrospirota bacterium]
MRCPFLAGKQFLTCTLNDEVYIPSFIELEEYCMSAGATKCPYPALILFGIAHTPKKAALSSEKIRYQDAA